MLFILAFYFFILPLTLYFYTFHLYLKRCQSHKHLIIIDTNLFWQILFFHKFFELSFWKILFLCYTFYQSLLTLTLSHISISSFINLLNIGFIYLLHLKLRRIVINRFIHFIFLFIYLFIFNIPLTYLNN